MSWRISRGDGGIVSGAGAGRPELERPLGADAGIAPAAMATAASAFCSFGFDIVAAAEALSSRKGGGSGDGVEVAAIGDWQRLRNRAGEGCVHITWSWGKGSDALRTRKVN